MLRGCCTKSAVQNRPGLGARKEKVLPRNGMVYGIRGGEKVRVDFEAEFEVSAERLRRYRRVV
jgi:hypothetical protein